MKKAYLILENGKVFQGFSCGAEGEVRAEIVFSTAMTGYLEALTDKSFYGQAVVQTVPLIGNYGVIPADFEADALTPAAYIVRELCDFPSNFRCEGKLDELLRKAGVVGLCGIDTRTLTRILREHGTMNCLITDDPAKADLSSLQNLQLKGAVEAVSCREKQVFGAEDASKHVVMLDYGYKRSIVENLVKRGCRVTVLPCTSTAEEVLALKPDGLMLSNGPGDPTLNPAMVEELKKLLPHKIPTFGICLGYQLLALANGASSVKMKYGHRGENQPVKDCCTGRIYISAQSHGYAIDPASLDPRICEQMFVNVNDGTCEGVLYHHMPAFGVQFHPEACGGPLDTEFLFDRFTAMMA